MIIDDEVDAFLFLKAFLEKKSYCVEVEVFSDAKKRYKSLLNWTFAL